MKKSQNSFISLAKGFQSVKLKSHNTASAIFPIMISKKNDLIIVFFNYWLNKNKINPNHIKFFADYMTKMEEWPHTLRKIFQTFIIKFL